MGDQDLPPGLSPGLFLRERQQREMHMDHINDHRPNAVEASRRLQNGLGLRNTDPWPIPNSQSSFVLDTTLLQRNGATLRAALTQSTLLRKAVDRGARAPYSLDPSIEKLRSRYASMSGRVESGSWDSWFDEVPFIKTEIDDRPRQDHSSSGSITEQSQHSPHVSHGERDESTDYASEPTQSQKPFPDPVSMPGSFTACVCQHHEFEVEPILTLTLKDMVPLMNHPRIRPNVLLHHFEVGLDGVEGIITGEVNMQESISWKKRVREPRLGKIGYIGGMYNRQLDLEQRAIGYGLGIWQFFGVKFKQTAEEESSATGRWFCFGAPIEAIQRFQPNEQLVTVGEKVLIEGQEYVKTLKLDRLSYCFSLGGAACMDVWEGGAEWEDGVFDRIREAMGDVGLGVESLQRQGDSLDAFSNTQIEYLAFGSDHKRFARDLAYESDFKKLAREADEAQIKRKRSDAADAVREQNEGTKRRVRND